MAVDLYQVILGGIAVALMVLVPIPRRLPYDLLVGRWAEGIGRRRERRSAAAAHRRGVRELRHQQGVPREQLAADLRRLRGILGTDVHRSAAHQMGNRLAYENFSCRSARCSRSNMIWRPTPEASSATSKGFVSKQSRSVRV